MRSEFANPLATALAILDEIPIATEEGDQFVPNLGITAYDQDALAVNH
jgi:hypothetical protein